MLQNISDGILVLSPGPCPKGETFGRCGCPEIIFFKHDHVAYQIDEKNTRGPEGPDALT